ncbi:hypothetical protein F2Q69_00047785 [Brassica cretica]|uniref:Uncharacterized protein n=1 Tax=Brassica cretica TaxID=69181 RepID=A0A8S9PVH8_BRACR|nr:hypothetical protein F2Q69_00047785 [Brassica cretica]
MNLVRGSRQCLSVGGSRRGRISVTLLTNNIGGSPRRFSLAPLDESRLRLLFQIVRKTFVVSKGIKKEPKQVPGEILSFFTRNNFNVTDRGETITFEGTMVPRRGQAALLTLCTCISLASVGLVLTITVPNHYN